MKTFLGIELGSTRVKSVLIDSKGAILAQGAFDWENRYENGVWLYYLDDVWRSLRSSVADLMNDYQKRHTAASPDISCIGISAMMHGYLAFDKDENQLAEFRTWRNTITQEAAEQLSAVFNFNIPQRYSIAHLYNAVIKKEPHVPNISFMTTLAGYVHYKLTNEKVIGIGDASGMFPVDRISKDYNVEMVEKFDMLSADYGFGKKLLSLLPKVLCAGEIAGRLTDIGARLLDDTGLIKPGIPFCPPEGDAQTGMTATNSLKPLTGNISAGTSVFATMVLPKDLSKMYPSVDIVATPVGLPAAMVHCNNCTSDLDSWIELFGSVVKTFGGTYHKSELYRTLYETALKGEPDCGGLVSVNYLSGEHTTGFSEGRPLFVRTPNSKLNVENFLRSLLFSSMATLRIGMDILTQGEGLEFSELLGHGGLFKTPNVGQRLMSAALKIPVTVMESAAEGGAWGIALLAAYAVMKNSEDSLTLEGFLDNTVFADSRKIIMKPDLNEIQGFERYLKLYKAALKVENVAVVNITI